MLWRIEHDKDGRVTLFCETYKWWVCKGVGWEGPTPFIDGFFDNLNRVFPLTNKELSNV